MIVGLGGLGQVVVGTEAKQQAEGTLSVNRLVAARQGGFLELIGLQLLMGGVPGRPNPAGNPHHVVEVEADVALVGLGQQVADGGARFCHLHGLSRGGRNRRRRLWGRWRSRRRFAEPRRGRRVQATAARAAGVGPWRVSGGCRRPYRLNPVQRLTLFVPRRLAQPQPSAQLPGRLAPTSTDAPLTVRATSSSARWVRDAPGGEIDQRLWVDPGEGPIRNLVLELTQREVAQQNRPGACAASPTRPRWWRG